MKLLNFKPNQYLRQYISRYWLWENESNLPQILPGTGTELIFHYATPFSGSDHKNNAFVSPNCHILSPRYGCYHLNPINNSSFIAVRFRAGAFRHFCGEDSNDLIDAFIDIDELWGKSGQEFGERVLEAKTIENRIIIIESFLMKFLARYKRPQSWLDVAVKKMFYDCDTATLTKVSNELAISNRQLQRKFGEAVGVSPKTFQRIARFENVLKELLLNKNSDYLAIALAHGYYDQSHFIKEFKEHVRQTPSLFLQDKNFRSHFYNKKSPD